MTSPETISSRVELELWETIVLPKTYILSCYLAMDKIEYLMDSIHNRVLGFESSSIFDYDVIRANIVPVKNDINVNLGFFDHVYFIALFDNAVGRSGLRYTIALSNVTSRAE